MAGKLTLETTFDYVGIKPDHRYLFQIFEESDFPYAADVCNAVRERLVEIGLTGDNISVLVGLPSANYHIRKTRSFSSGKGRYYLVWQNFVSHMPSDEVMAEWRSSVKRAMARFLETSPENIAFIALVGGMELLEVIDNKALKEGE